MEQEIIILNVNYYKNEEKGTEGTRVGFIFADEKYNLANPKFKGYSNLNGFYKPNVFNIITNDMIGKKLKATITTQPSDYNPLELRQVVEKIEYKGTVLNLL